MQLTSSFLKFCLCTDICLCCIFLGFFEYKFDTVVQLNWLKHDSTICHRCWFEPSHNYQVITFIYCCCLFFCFFFVFFFVILNEFALYFDCICVDGYVFENLFANIFLICCIVVQKKFFFLDDNFCNHFIIFVFFEVEFCEYRVSNANQQKNFWYTFACIFLI